MKRTELITRLLEKLRGNECRIGLGSQGYYLVLPGCGIKDCHLLENELIIVWESTFCSPTRLPLMSFEYDRFLSLISLRLEIKVPEGAFSEKR